MTFLDHFSVVDDAVGPQPWMQLRRVATSHTPSVSKGYDPNDGWPKSEILQSLTASWTNNGTLSQWVYGMVSKSGSSVSLQCRSRGYLTTSHGVIVGNISGIAMNEVSRFGVGSDLGNGGILATGGAYGISELRQNSTTIPLAPQLTGWFAVAPGQTINAQVTVGFVSEFWESTQIDGGNGDTESKVITGDLQIDLFALPAIIDPKPRLVPSIVGTATGSAISSNVTVAKPTGTTTGDMMIAICGNQFGSGAAITAPAGWNLLHGVNDRWYNIGISHLKIFTKQATASEPASYSFGNGALAEEIVHIITLRNAAPLVAVDAGASGWSAASTQKKWTKTGDLHVAPSIDRSGQLLICVSFMGRTDYPFDLTLGPVAITQTQPPGMTETVDLNLTSASMSVAYLANPPMPTNTRTFTSVPRAFFSSYAITASILIGGITQ